MDGNGIALSPTMTFFSANGGANNEGRMAVNGMTVGAARSGGVSSYVYDAVGVEEVSIRVGGGLGETDTGGPIMNIVPRSGGNTFAGTAFTSLAGDWSRGDNLNDELRALRPDRDARASSRRTTPASRSAARFCATVSGSTGSTATSTRRPRSKASPRTPTPATRPAGTGCRARSNARLVQDRMMAMGRFAGQAGRSRFNVNYEYQKRCEGTPLRVGTEGCHNRGEDWVGLGTTTPVAGGDGHGGRAATSNGRST